jgi:hypothetical protein
VADLTPPQQEHLTSVLGWCNEAIQEGENFLRSQLGYDKIPTTIANIMGDYSADMSQASLSDIVDNRLGKCAEDLVSSLTDIKPFWEYRTYNKKFDEQASMLGKLSVSWFLGRAIDMKFADVVRYNVVAGTGYTHQIWNEQISDLDMLAEDPRDCVPVRPSSYYSIQEALGVLIRRERTVNFLKAKYPRAAQHIKADRDASFIARAAARVQTALAKLNISAGPFWESLGGKPQLTLNVPAADLYTLYVHDESKNETSRKVWVGEGDPNGAHPNWSYWVEPGKPLYPRGRNIMFTRSAVLRDGPNIYWHGLFPVSKLSLNPWPWSWLGKPLLLDVLPLQKELNRLLRGVSDHNQKVFRPDLIADKNSMSRAAQESIDTRRAGLKLRVGGGVGLGATLNEVKPLDTSIENTIKFLIEEMQELSGTKDLAQMMRLGQIPTTETIEKIMESMTPSVRMRSRVIETFMREFAMMTASNFFQFYDTAKRVAILGPDGMTFEDFDYDPGTMIPAFINEEDEVKNVKRPRYDRAREFLRMFTYHIAPGSLLSASEVTRKLLYIQLARAGWVDIWTTLEVLGIPNVGNPPNDSKTIPERLMAQQEMGIGMSVSPTGRKATAQTMPHEKDGKIVESK